MSDSHASGLLQSSLQPPDGQTVRDIFPSRVSAPRRWLGFLVDVHIPIGKLPDEAPMKPQADEDGDVP
jgi:hypothetical protein